MRKGLVVTGMLILAAGLLIFGASFALPIKTSALWYAKVAGINVCGLLLTVIGVYLDNLKNLFKSSPAIAKEDIPIDLEMSMEKDYQCINYLSKRFKTMHNVETKKEGLRLLSEAHSLLYKDYHLEEVHSDVNVVATT